MTIPERVLLGPGPSPVAARVMQALAAPVMSHLDPHMLAILDEVRARLGRVFDAGGDALNLAVSGTGTSGMEAAAANVTAEGSRVVVVVNGYFGDRLARIFEAYGATVTRVAGDWGRACDLAAVERAVASDGCDVVAVVHAETSTGVLNPAEEVVKIANAAGALSVVDAVTSFGAMPLHVGPWGIDVCYSCTQKGLGAPSGLAPVSFSSRARLRRAGSRSFYLDLGLLEEYWLGRKYHHTISAPLVYALREALVMVEEEGLEARWERHRRTHLALTAGLQVLGLDLLPPAAERLWTLNAVRVPDGIDEAAVRRQLLDQFNIEIGAGLGPLAGRIWRVGLMGSGSSLSNVLLFLGALERVLGSVGFRPRGRGADRAAADAVSS